MLCKVIPVSTYDPDTVIPEYMPLEPKELPPLTTNPRKMEDIIFTERLTKERIEMIIGNIPNGFLRKAELELILDIIFEFENAFAFTHAECGTFNTKYYPEYTMQTVPHVPWQIKPICLPKSREAEIMEMLEDQCQARKYELSSSSYRSAVFAVEKKNHSMTVSMFHVGVPIDYSSDSPYIRLIFHGKFLVGRL
jgi:predicted RNA-binding protein associated with RNAse of E/G family